MTIYPISLGLGSMPLAEFVLPDTSGLAPLEIPIQRVDGNGNSPMQGSISTSLPKTPSEESIHLFRTLMAQDKEVPCSDKKPDFELLANARAWTERFSQQEMPTETSEVVRESSRDATEAPILFVPKEQQSVETCKTVVSFIAPGESAPKIVDAKVVEIKPTERPIAEIAPSKVNAPERPIPDQKVVDVAPIKVIAPVNTDIIKADVIVDPLKTRPAVESAPVVTDVATPKVATPKVVDSKIVAPEVVVAKAVAPEVVATKVVVPETVEAKSPVIAEAPVDTEVLKADVIVEAPKAKPAVESAPVVADVATPKVVTPNVVDSKIVAPEVVVAKAVAPEVVATKVVVPETVEAKVAEVKVVESKPTEQPTPERKVVDIAPSAVRSPVIAEVPVIAEAPVDTEVLKADVIVEAPKAKPAVESAPVVTDVATPKVVTPNVVDSKIVAPEVVVAKAVAPEIPDAPDVAEAKVVEVKTSVVPDNQPSVIVPKRQESVPLAKVETEVSDDPDDIVLSSHIAALQTTHVVAGDSSMMRDITANADALAASARTSEIAATVSEIVEAVTAQIEVTPSLVKGEGEIVLRLKPTVLDGSEIKLTAKSGELSIVVAPTTSHAAQIVSNNIPQLERALAEHLPAFSNISVLLRKKEK